MADVVDIRDARRFNVQPLIPERRDEEAVIAGVLQGHLDALPMLEVDDFVSAARQVYTAARNLEARGVDVTASSVSAELAQYDVLSGDDEMYSDRSHAAQWPLARLEKLASIKIPRDVVMHAASRLMDVRASRERVLESEDERDRIEDEVTDQALRDADIDEEPVPDVTQWDKALADALVDVKSALGSSVTTGRKPLFVDAHDLFTREYPATPWLVTGLITRGGVAQFGAEPKSGKTWLALETSIGVATGSRVCGEFYAQRGVVAYFFAEDLDRQVRNRVRALLACRGLTAEAIRGRLHVCPRGTTLDVCRDEDLAWVVASVRMLGPIDMLVLDPLRDIHSGKENESDDMSDVMRRLKALGTILGCTVAFAHHAGKPSKDGSERRAGQRSRGSGAIHGSTDSGIYFGLRSGDGKYTLELGVEVEIKGAGGAGRFTVRLDVQDDAHGEAVRASWAMTNGIDQPTSGRLNGPTITDQDREDDDAVFVFVSGLVKRGLGLTQRCLREHKDRPSHMGKPLPVRRMTDSLKRLETNRRLVRIEGLIRLPESSSNDLFSTSEPDPSGSGLVQKS